jgi:hypothetical protein
MGLNKKEQILNNKRYYYEDEKIFAYNLKSGIELQMYKSATQQNPNSDSIAWYIIILHTKINSKNY